MKPRKYQIECHDAILAHWGIAPYHDGESDVFRSVVANLATSAGKTIIAAMIIKTVVDLGKRCLFVADTDELCAQPVKKLHSAVGIFASVEKAQDRASLSADVVVASLQSMRRESRLMRYPSNHFDFIFIDEAHRQCDAAKVITDYFPAAKVCGMTATAFRSKLADLSKWYECVAYEKQTFDLIGEGYLPPITVQTLDLKVDLDEVKVGTTADGRDYQSDSLASVIEPHLRAVAQVIKEKASSRQILAFLPLIATSKMFVDICQQEGLSAKHCDGTSDDREEILAGFERKDFQILANSQLFSTGVDFQSCDCLLNLRPTKSVGLFRQMVGRILRPLPGTIDGIECPEERKRAIAASAKPDSLILDLLYNAKMGLVGPASLIVDETDSEAVTKRVREAKSPEELFDIASDVRRQREEALREELEKRVNLEKKWTGLMPAELVAVWLHVDYAPAFPWERGTVKDETKVRLEKAGINPNSVENEGQALALLEACWKRQKAGKLSIHAFRPLRNLGVADPSEMALDDAIRLLKDGFPMTFGKWAGTPLRDINKGYWSFIWHKTDKDWIQRNHPAVYRYLKNVVYAPKKELAS
jgi:superfamily II DNA or RNA helicase